MKNLLKPAIRALILVAVVSTAVYLYYIARGVATPLGQVLPIAAFIFVMSMFNSYRTDRGLDPNPPWLMIGIGVIGLGFYTFWVLSPEGPHTPAELAGIALLAAVPAALLVYGIRKLRKMPEPLP
ncbi:MAG: hypothetical protein V4503_01565 [Gemmatimonadota bacterium]